MEESCSTITSYSLQPCLILINEPANDLKIYQMFLKVDQQTILIPGASIINGLDILFKLFWIFNICYSNHLDNFMYFIELIFKMNKVTKPAVNEVYNIIIKDDE